MKIYVYEKRIILTGKVREVQQKLREYQQDFLLVSTWIQHIHRKYPQEK
jgi:hypothetical protein